MLALQFAIVHSFLLLPAVRKRITRILADQLYGSLFAVSTCAGLWLLFVCVATVTDHNLECNRMESEH